MKLKKIKINGMHNIDEVCYDLSDITYFHGKNGAGKSTILQAIQFALLGYIPGTAKRTSAIFNHANGDYLSVELTVENDGDYFTVTRSLRKSLSGSSVESYLVIDPDNYDIHDIIADIELPIFNFDEFLDMSPNKLKEWFVCFLPNHDVDIDWSTELITYLQNEGFTDVNQSIVDELVDRIKQDSLDDVASVNAMLKSELTLLKKDRDRLQSTVQSLIYYDDIDDVQDEEAISNEIDRIRRRINIYNDSVAKHEYVRSNNESIRQQLSSILDKITSDDYTEDTRYKECIEMREDLEAKLADQESKVEEYRSKIRQFNEERSRIETACAFKKDVVNHEGVCPYTNIKCKDVGALIESYREDIEEAEDNISKCNKQLDRLMKSIEKSEETQRTIRTQLNDVQRELSSIEYNYKQKRLLESQMLDEVEIDESYDVDSDRELLHSLNDTLVKISANRKYQKMIDSITSEKMKLDTSIEYYKHWINFTGVNGLQTDMSEQSPFYILSESMNIYIRKFFEDDCSVDFGLSTKSNSFELYLNRGGKFISFNLLSSGEKCLFSLALMISLVEIADCTLKIVLVDDLLDHLDDSNMEKLFNSLEKVSDVQMIFAGVKNINKEYQVSI